MAKLTPHEKMIRALEKDIAASRTRIEREKIRLQIAERELEHVIKRSVEEGEAK